MLSFNFYCTVSGGLFWKKNARYNLELEIEMGTNVQLWA